MNKKIETSDEHQEQVNYKFKDFPLAIFCDDFDFFVNHSFCVHWHNEIELAIVLRGMVKYYLNQEPYIIEEGDGIFIGSRTLHSAEQMENGSLAFNILFPTSILSQMFHNISLHKYMPKTSGWFNRGCLLRKDVPDEAEILKALRKINESTWSSDSELIQAEAMLHIWQYLPKLCENFPAASPVSLSIREERMRNMITYIHENYMYPINAISIAAAANISRSECFRCFSIFGKSSPIDYLIAYRLHVAARKLVETNESISDISNGCGFSSTSYFSKTFKNNYGITPVAFRKQNGNLSDQTKIIVF